MGLWLPALSLAYGVLMALDPLIYTYVAYGLTASGLYLGVCNALWSASYILSSLLLGPLGDRGSARLLAAASAASAALSWLCLRELTEYGALAGYALHAISLAALNLALNAAILDNVDSDEWNRAILASRLAGQAVRGAVLLCAALAPGVSVAALLQAAALLALASAALAPPSPIVSERRLFRLYYSLRELGSYIRASASLAYLERPATLVSALERAWPWGRGASPLRVGAVALLVSCVGDYIFTALPLVMRGSVGLREAWLAYGAASLALLPAAAAVRKAGDSGGRLVAALIVIRGLLLTLCLPAVGSATALALYVLMSSTLFIAIDTALYSMYVEASQGYGASLYYSLRELGSVVGGILGGLLVGLGAGPYSTTALAITALSAVLLLL